MSSEKPRLELISKNSWHSASYWLPIINRQQPGAERRRLSETTPRARARVVCRRTISDDPSTFALFRAILEISTIVFIVYSFEYFLGGQMFPIDIMPTGIQAAMKWLPFYYELFCPVAIFLERLRGN